MMSKLNIIIVWHNEEENLPKLFESLKNFDGKVDYGVIYCDQESTDNSVKIAKQYWVIVHEHPKYWICETSRYKRMRSSIIFGCWWRNYKWFCKRNSGYNLFRWI